MASAYQIIGKINPLLYSKNGKDLLKEYGSSNNIPADKVEPVAIRIDKDKINLISGSESKHTIVYESYSETLEPIYYFILDLMDFRLRLQSYEDLKDKDPDKSAAARLSLKQIWLDKVDVNKGNSSIKAMALGQGGFVTLIDAFLAANDVSDITHKLDLNDRVKRILIPRIQEFNYWIAQSEVELRKRYELEKNYLRSQVNSLKLYSRWAKPYLIAAQQIEQTPTKSASLVKSFNRTILQLTIMGKAKVKKEAVVPKNSQKYVTRDYNSCILVDFVFRAVPAQTNYIGRADVKFTAYSLNDDELKKFQEEFAESDLTDVLKLIEGATGESLKQMQDEINFFLEEKTR